MQMKMVMAVVPRDDADAVLEALISSGLTATFTESRGGMLRQAQKTLFIAVPADRLQTVLDILKPPHVNAATADTLRTAPKTTSLSSNVVFIWDIERYEGS
ncbi:MAG: hypothetical protein GX620_08980 [Chloroflexi bacterium]|nr:hypothetical protein [Chloroflexota bacterium]